MLIGLVPRYKRIKYTGFNLNENQEQSGEVSGFAARVIQHETDHIKGVLFPDIAERILTLQEYENNKHITLSSQQ